jgi:hypothetical protein
MACARNGGSREHEYNASMPEQESLMSSRGTTYQRTIAFSQSRRKTGRGHSPGNGVFRSHRVAAANLLGPVNLRQPHGLLTLPSVAGISDMCANVVRRIRDLSQTLQDRRAARGAVSA